MRPRQARRHRPADSERPSGTGSGRSPQRELTTTCESRAPWPGDGQRSAIDRSSGWDSGPSTGWKSRAPRAGCERVLGPRGEGALGGRTQPRRPSRGWEGEGRVRAPRWGRRERGTPAVRTGTPGEPREAQAAGKLPGAAAQPWRGVCLGRTDLHQSALPPALGAPPSLGAPWLSV